MFTSTIRFLPNWIALLLLAAAMDTATAQKYDLLIKGGHLIDPASQLNQVMDVAIADGKIVKIAQFIADPAARIIDARGLYVTPGFIDMHTHVFVGPEAGLFANGSNSVSPDDFSFRSGITTVVDAGTSGWRNFPLFKKQVIDQSKTRILAFLNISGEGMTGDKREQDLTDMNSDSTANLILKYPEQLAGVKIGHFNGDDWTPFDRALAAAKKAGRPLFVECHLPRYSLEDQLAKMRPGDIITHSFENIPERMPILGGDSMVRPFVVEAKRRGILFDLGHGGAGFWFDQAAPAVKQGFYPDSFGTDLHRFSMNSAMKDMTNVLSKFMALGMRFEEVIQTATWNPARAIGHPELGILKEGGLADLVLLRVREGTFGFVDSGGNRITGKQKIEAELTIRDGKIVWDLNGLGAKKFKM